MRFISYLLFFILGISSVHAEIKIGTVHYFPPFIINKNQGFDIELMNYLCQKIKIKCSFVQMKDSELFKALENRKVNLVMAGIMIPPHSQGNYIFSLPYLPVRAVFIVPAQSNLKQETDLNGKIVGAANDLNGEVFVDYLQTNFQNQLQIKKYDSPDTLINDLENGTLSAAFVREFYANYWQNNGLTNIRVLGQPREVGNGMAIVALPEEQALIDKINKELQSIEKNGDYLKLYKTYFGDKY
ncbi:transporter substrate-binding domain-containing protein [Legionella longbeachae]|uniref:Putative arginine-binding periplasmic protein n=1 Tax=Legionella longbeachae serogroup 1 (strain NSW150) TaxID=661367 RepID=D3HSZ3_LEGLN|nr:transporter substrate-binding domain-containing protein [Legionella longbeachae]VEE02524.1 arginine-binding periplasmic protein [Legionella oakridgensis]HBD7398784.1 transporter substrate-binding domain-containing protein [Legionella pneumophila]ARB91204.1 ABC transporter substrate-binding protein [Legionella longbeachae]EEZ94836.1 bacterial extracellular solute-binding family protein [Legionella longbeachae D-4968]QIN32371.1 transporter substrate-binding domain-containing protein [Legionel